MIDSYSSAIDQISSSQLDFYSVTEVGQFTTSSNFMMNLCKLNFEEYSKTPHLYPMFKYLLSLSKCDENKSGEVITRSNSNVMTNILQLQNESSVFGRVLYPTAFIFHESRVGSTLIANILAKDPLNLVFSESSPPVSSLFCGSCSEKVAISRLIDVMTLMGRSPYHQRLFFKFQSIMTTKIQIILKAYPDVPWIFLYRKPVQVLMSHISPWKLDGSKFFAPCLRSKSDSPPYSVNQGLQILGFNVENATNVAWCSSHLYMLCRFAFSAYEQFHTYKHNEIFPQRVFKHHRHPQLEYTYLPANRLRKHGEIRGMLVDYEDLPGILLSLLYPLWGIGKLPNNHSLYSTVLTESNSIPSISFKFNSLSSIFEKEINKNQPQRFSQVFTSLSPVLLQNFAQESQEHSKSGASWNFLGYKFGGDSKSKDNWANQEIQDASEGLLESLYKLMKNSTDEDLKRILLNNEMSSLKRKVDWKPFPVSLIINEDNNNLENQETNQNQNQIEWKIPSMITGQHTSQPYESISCPSQPSQSYPKLYSLSQIISSWNPEIGSIPSRHYRSLCKFDYMTEYSIAQQYFDKELPFILYNHPEVNQAVLSWKNVDHLNSLFGSNSFYPSEHSQANHFDTIEDKMNINSKKKVSIKMISTTFEKWLQFAIENYFQNDVQTVESIESDSIDQLQEKIVIHKKSKKQKRRKNGYRTLHVSGIDRLNNEFPSLFQLNQSSFLKGNVQGRGCQFEMNSIISNQLSDSDSVLRFIVHIHGLKRWILSPPSQDTTSSAPLLSNEIILQEGELLFIPRNWNSYSTTLNIVYECNL